MELHDLLIDFQRNLGGSYDEYSIFVASSSYPQISREYWFLHGFNSWWSTIAEDRKQTSTLLFRDLAVVRQFTLLKYLRYCAIVFIFMEIKQITRLDGKLWIWYQVINRKNVEKRVIGWVDTSRCRTCNCRYDSNTVAYFRGLKIDRFVHWASVLRMRDLVLFDPWIWDPVHFRPWYPGWVKNQNPDLRSGSRMNIPDHIS